MMQQTPQIQVPEIRIPVDDSIIGAVSPISSKQLYLTLPTAEWLMVRYAAAQRKVSIAELCRRMMEDGLKKLAQEGRGELSHDDKVKAFYDAKRQRDAANSQNPERTDREKREKSFRRLDQVRRDQAVVTRLMKRSPNCDRCGGQFGFRLHERAVVSEKADGSKVLICRLCRGH